MAKEKPIAEITHYFDKIGVAVLAIKGKLKVGDKIKIKGGEVEFEQVIDSMQIDKDQVKAVKKGDDVGMKVDQKVRPGYKAFLVK